MVAGRKAIFWIASIISIASFGLMMIYFIVFGDTMKSLIAQLVFGKNDGGMFVTRGFYVILLAASLFPLIIRKELEELKIASIILFVGVASFLLILTF
jgi:amino acid permease